MSTSYHSRQGHGGYILLRSDTMIPWLQYIKLTTGVTRNGNDRISPFFRHQETKHRPAEQAILVFAEMLKATSRVQVYPVHVLSGGRPEVIYGISEGLTAAIRPHSESIATPFHQQLMEAFVSFVKDEGKSLRDQRIVQMDPDTVAFITRLWGAVGFGVFGFNIRGMCSVRSVSRYGSYPTGSRQPVQDEFRHIVKSEALTRSS